MPLWAVTNRTARNWWRDDDPHAERIQLIEQERGKSRRILRLFPEQFEGKFKLYDERKTRRDPEVNQRAAVNPAFLAVTIL